MKNTLLVISAMTLSAYSTSLSHGSEPRETQSPRTSEVGATPIDIPQPPAEATLKAMSAYNNGDFKTAYQHLRRAADAADPEGLVNLGYLYARGHGVAADQIEALRLYRLAAKAGSSEGMNAIGYKYLHSTGVAKDLDQAKFWFCQAIARGNPRAMNNLALMLVTGELPFDELEARSLWMQAAELGHSNAMNNLGFSFLEGRDRNPQKAREWLIRAAQAGHSMAQDVLRAEGYAGALPPPVDFGGNMKPEPKQAVGQTKMCR